MTTNPDGKGQGMENIKDSAYAEFTSHQRAHDCPGFDCAICYECFDAITFQPAVPVPDVVWPPIASNPELDKQSTQHIANRAWNAAIDACIVAHAKAQKECTHELKDIQSQECQCAGAAHQSKRRDKETITADDLRADEILAIFEAQADTFGYLHIDTAKAQKEQGAVPTVDEIERIIINNFGYKSDHPKSKNMAIAIRNLFLTKGPERK